MVEGTIVQAENNALIGSAEERLAEQRRRGRSVDAGIDIAAYAAGFIPGYGQIVGGVDTGADVLGIGVGEALFPTDTGELDEATAEATEREMNASANLAILNALANGATPPPVTPGQDISDAEFQAFKEWLRPYSDEHAHNAMVSGFHQSDVQFRDRR